MGRAFYKAIAALLITVSFFSCKKEECDCLPPVTNPDDEKVFIVCEGSYGSGNSSLSMYLPEKDSVYGDVYQSINNKSLGDVFQSMVRVGDMYYLCINNSDRIISLNKDLQLNTTATVAKPRYIMPVGPLKVYISSLYSNKLVVFNPVSMSTVKTINMPALNPEGMLLLGDKAYICPWDTAGNKMYVVNTTTDAVSDSIELPGRAPSEVLPDKDGKLWVLSGNVAKGKPAYWTRVDPETKQVLKTYPFPAGADPVHPVMNNAMDSLYFIEVNYNLGTAHNGIFRMSIHDNDLPATPFIPAQQGQYFWALGISPFNGDIYVGDPKGFVQKGMISIYGTDGIKKEEFNVGVGPGHFYFSR